MKVKIIALISLLSIGLFNTSCDPEDVKPVLGINCTRTQCLDLEKFAQGIENRLDGKVMKYGYHIRSGFAVHEKAVGLAKTIVDGGNVNFTVNQRFNPASVTKTITAVALLRAMEQNDIGIHQSIRPYLPTSWNAHSSINGITFEQVLAHKSGFRNSVAGSYDHAGVKNAIEAGVKAVGVIHHDQLPLLYFTSRDESSGRNGSSKGRQSTTATTKEKRLRTFVVHHFQVHAVAFSYSDTRH